MWMDFKRAAAVGVQLRAMARCNKTLTVEIRHFLCNISYPI
jgi:hypothetical protein